MERDIVEKLRDPRVRMNQLARVALDAADEIERLRAAMLLTADRAMGRDLPSPPVTEG